MTTKIVFVLPNFSGGGAARVASVLCNSWILQGHEVHLATFEEPGDTSVYPLDSHIYRYQLGFKASPKGLLGVLRTNLARIRVLRRLFKIIQPDIVISFLLEPNIATTIAASAIRAPVLISERNHPGYHNIGKSRALVRAIVYPRADLLCVQTQDIRHWFQQNLKLNAIVIPNPVAPNMAPEGPSTVQSTAGRKRVISLGRLEPQKGYDFLIEAFARVAATRLDWELVIFGDGTQRANLEAKVSSLGLDERVLLPGTTMNPSNEYFAADIFISASRYEGYPNAIIEALAAGLCVVATDCPGATREILRDGKYGVLAPAENAEELASALASVMDHNDTRMAFAKRARQAVRHLNANAIANQWLEILKTDYSAGGR